MQSQTERLHTVVIGAGQYGLLTGYYLAESGVSVNDFVILEAHERVGDSWRKRWDSLRLFTPASWSDLPGLPFPAPSKKHFPSKEEAANYLEQYAAKFKLPVRLGVRVESIAREGDIYVVTASGGRRFEAKNVVVAAGPFQKPRIPSFASQLDPSINQFHSSAYRNPAQLKDGNTLIVGAAVSGCEIAMELKGYHRNALHKLKKSDGSAGTPHRVVLAGPKVASEPPRAILMLFASFMMSRPKDSVIGKKLFNIARHMGHPIVDFTYKDLAKVNIERAGRVTGVSGGKPQLDDGSVLDVANVIFATGYGIDFSWIKLPIFEEDGYPRHARGVVENEPGLYFVGLIFLHTLSSHLWRGVKRDTKYVADALVRRSHAKGSAAVSQPGVRASSTA